MEHRQTLIAARLAPGVSPLAGLPSLVRVLRRRSECAGLSGGLLYDGEWVVMLFEGAPADVAALLDTLADARQLNGPPDVLVDQVAVPGEQPLTRWIAGYAEPELVDALRRSDRDAAASTQAFKQALGASDAL